MRYLALLACILVLGCDKVRDDIETTTQIQNVYVLGPGNPTTEPTVDGNIAAVFVGPFGVEVGNNPAEGSAIRVGNTQPITCTPKLEDGEDAPPAVHGPTPDFFGIIAGANVARLDSTDNPFNKLVVGLSPGVVSITCSVKGANGSLSLNVVS